MCVDNAEEIFVNANAAWCVETKTIYGRSTLRPYKINE